MRDTLERERESSACIKVYKSEYRYQLGQLTSPWVLTIRRDLRADSIITHVCNRCSTHETLEPFRAQPSLWKLRSSRASSCIRISLHYIRVRVYINNIYTHTRDTRASLGSLDKLLWFNRGWDTPDTTLNPITLPRISFTPRHSIPKTFSPARNFLRMTKSRGCNFLVIESHYFLFNLIVEKKKKKNWRIFRIFLSRD